MKHKHSKRIISLLLAIVMVMGILLMTTLTVAAQDVYGTVYASSLSNGAGLDVYAKTKLVMDVDRAFAYIEGNYDVTANGKITVTGNSTDYAFSDVAAGIYTLKVSKNNHVTREYTVVVNNSTVVQDVKICLKGDATGDGKVNMKDWNRLYEHLNEVKPLW